MTDFLDLQQVRDLVFCTPPAFKNIQGTAVEYEILFNDFKVVLIVGSGAYCKPRLDLDKLEYYSHVQISIFENLKDHGQIVKPLFDERFKNLPWSNLFSYVSANGKVESSYIAIEVPMETIYQIIKDIYKISRLKIFY